MNSRRSVQRSLRIVRDDATDPDPDPSPNWLLASLPPPVLGRMTPRLELVTLQRKQVLFGVHQRVPYVYFPATAVVSLVAAVDSGEALAVGWTGRDGLVGMAAVPEVAAMPCEGVVQIGGEAYRVEAAPFRDAMLADETLQTAVARYGQLLLARSMQMQVCNMFHPVEQRLIRWLLTVSDLVASGDIPLTHELLATLLGVRRPTVTVVVGSLQRAGLIVEKRGRLAVRDRERLEAACCDCYRVMCEQQEHLLGYSCSGVSMTVASQ